MAVEQSGRKSWKRFLWPTVGAVAILVSFWLLTRELKGFSWDALWLGFHAISALHWLLIGGCTLGCYITLAFYDGFALEHLGKKLNFFFVSLCALTSYALSHTIGASAFTGAVIRYRAYTTKGLTGPEVGVLATFCSLTFSLGVLMLMGLILLITPGLEDRLSDHLPPDARFWTAGIVLAVVGLYILGAALRLPPLRIRNFTLFYPRLSLAVKQVFVAPVELLFAGGIVYFALPVDGNPGYLVVTGVFIVAFSLALLSHAPGGLGVFELVAIAGLPEFDAEQVLAALIVFRIFYFMIPLLIGLVVVALFERAQLKEEAPQPPVPGA